MTGSCIVSSDASPCDHSYSSLLFCIYVIDMGISFCQTFRRTLLIKRQTPVVLNKKKKGKFKHKKKLKVRDRDICLKIKIRLFRALVISIFLYSCESWTA